MEKQAHDYNFETNEQIGKIYITLFFGLSLKYIIITLNINIIY